MSMKIKTALDMQGNGIENFLIQGVSAIEGLSDKSLGRKILYTGTNTDRNYREMIYIGNSIGGDGWRTTAYMSDVDELRGLITALENATDEEIEALKGRATTTEGNLATLRSEFDALNKALNDDTAGVIDTWSEVVDFVNEYNGSQDLSTILAGMNTKIDGKLDLAGGTMKDASTINWGGNLVGWDDVSNGFIGISNFKGDSTFGYYVGLSFKGYYGFQIRSYGGGDLYEVRGHNSSNWGTWRTLLHSGNYSDLITTLNGDLSIGGAVNVGTGGLRVQGNLNTPIAINGSSIKRYGRGGGYLLSDDYYGLTPTKRLVQVGVFANDDELKYYCIGNRIESSAGGEKWFTINSASSAFFVPTSFASGITTNELTIGGIRLSVENGLLKIEGSAFATGELAAGGAATEGNGGAGGFSLYESWGTSAPTEPLALGANLGYELKTRVEDLELAKTKVTFEPTLASGKQIGAITIDGNKTNLFAPATYAWSEIDGRPTSLSQFTDDVVSGKYLPKTGGELKGLNPYHQYILTLDTDNVYYTILSLKSQGVRKGDFRWTSDDTTIVGVSIYNATTKDALGLSDDGLPMYNKYTLLHSGNVGEYALKTDGSNAMNAPLHLYHSTIDKYDGTFVCQSNLAGGAPFNYASVVNIEDERFSSMQLAWYRNLATPMLSFRISENGTFSAWKQIAFTDSDITGNAATATKLKNSVTLWGNTFDGTQSLSERILLSNNTSVDFYSSDAQKTINAVSVSNANVVAFGWGAIQHGFGSNFYGKSLTFTAGEYTSRATAMTITDGGNVLVGTNYLDNVKFSVHGGLSAFYVSGQTITLNSVPSNGLVLGGNIHTLAQYLMDNGQFAIQSYRRNTGVAESLNLNPLGGAVNIASANANTNVLGHLIASKDLYMSGFLMMNHGKEGIYIAGASLNWHNTNNAWSASLLSFAKDSFTIHPSLYVNGLANFSSRVLIGNGTDDGSTNLQVNGTSAFYGSTTFGKENLTMQVNFKCPVVAEDRVTIGGATLRWDEEIKALRLNTSLAATGELSAGGAGTEGGNTGGGGTGTIASPFSRTFTPNEKTSFTFSHDLPYYDVVVQVYEWDSSGMCWNMVLADVEIQNNDVTVTLGRKENVEHKIVVR